MANGSKENPASDSGVAAQREPPPGIFERVTSWISAILIALVIGFLVWEGLSKDEPVDFDVRATTTLQVDGRYYVTLEIRNTGDISVRNVSLRAELREGTETVASSEVSVEWLPAQSSRKTVAIFEENPDRYRLAVVPVGYELP